MQPFRCNYNSMFYIYGAEQRTGYAHSCLRDCISGILLLAVMDSLPTKRKREQTDGEYRNFAVR